MFYCSLFQAIPANAEQQLVDFLLSNLIQSFDVTDTPDDTSNLIQSFDTPLQDINSEGERINSLSASFWFSLHKSGSHGNHI